MNLQIERSMWDHEEQRHNLVSAAAIPLQKNASDWYNN